MDVQVVVKRTRNRACHRYVKSREPVSHTQGSAAAAGRRCRTIVVNLVDRHSLKHFIKSTRNAKTVQTPDASGLVTQMSLSRQRIWSFGAPLRTLSTRGELPLDVSMAFQAWRLARLDLHIPKHTVLASASEVRTSRLA
jgi:hypothetical protein